MNAIRNRSALPAIVLAGLFSLGIGAPAHAVADYTIDCDQTQGPPYVDSDPLPEVWYSLWYAYFDGTQERIITVNIVNCEYHGARDDPSGWIFQGYVGTDANEDYTVTIPVDGNAEVGGYNTSPAQTNFTIRFGNESAGGGGGGGGGNDTDSLANTGSIDATSALLVGLSAFAVGLSLYARRGRRARG